MTKAGIEASERPAGDRAAISRGVENLEGFLSERGGPAQGAAGAATVVEIWLVTLVPYTTLRVNLFKMKSFIMFATGALILGLSLTTIQDRFFSSFNRTINYKKASIFHIVILEATPIAIADSDWKEAQKHPVIGKLVSAELASCRQKKKTCLMPFYKEGTAFLMGSSGDLWSAAHLFEDQLLAELEKRKIRNGETFEKTISNFRPKFLLMDANLNTVFDSRTALRPAKSIFIGDPVRFKDLLDKKLAAMGIGIGKDGTSSEYTQPLEFRKRLFDFVHIRMPEILDYPNLPIAQDSSFFQKDAYVAGPDKLVPVQRQFTCSRGLSNFFERISPSCKLLEDFFISYTPALKVGTSGSPVLSKEGEVLGIHAYSGEADGMAIHLRWAEEVISHANSADRSL